MLQKPRFQQKVLRQMVVRLCEDTLELHGFDERPPSSVRVHHHLMGRRCGLPGACCSCCPLPPVPHWAPYCSCLGVAPARRWDQQSGVATTFYLCIAGLAAKWGNWSAQAAQKRAFAEAKSSMTHLLTAHHLRSGWSWMLWAKAEHRSATPQRRAPRQAYPRHRR